MENNYFFSNILHFLYPVFVQSETAGGRSLYERLKREIANLHSIRVDQVDIFTLRDVDGGVDVRYNCHSSPYYSTVRLNAVMMQRRERVGHRCVLHSDIKVKFHPF